MSKYPAYLLTTPIAEDGDKVITPATASAAGTGRLSQEKGWQEINARTISEGGIPPYREDFNGALYLLSQLLLWYQQGGIMTYNTSLDYEAGNEIFYGGKKYRCLAENGPSSAIAAPSDSAKWECVDTGAVLYDEAQTLTVEEQARARSNIGVYSSSEVDAMGTVRYDTVQALASTQTAQARTNIDVYSKSEVEGMAVRYDAAQSLTSAQQTQARSNIGVYSKSEVASLVNGVQTSVNALSSTVSNLSSSCTFGGGIGTAHSAPVAAKRITVTVFCHLYLDLNDSTTRVRTYTVKVGGSSVGTVTLSWPIVKTGGAGHGRYFTLLQTGYVSLSRTVSSGASIQITRADTTAVSGDSITSEFALISLSD